METMGWTRRTVVMAAACRVAVGRQAEAAPTSPFAADSPWNTAPGSCSTQHRFRKIERRDVRRTGCEPVRVATRAATDLNHFTVLEGQIHLSQDLCRQFARTVRIAIIGFGPSIVSRGDFGFICSFSHLRKA